MHVQVTWNNCLLFWQSVLVVVVVVGIYSSPVVLWSVALSI